MYMMGGGGGGGVIKHMPATSSLLSFMYKIIYVKEIVEINPNN